MTLLVEVNLSPDWVEALVAGDFEAVHWRTLGSPRAPDAEIMAFARTHDMVVITHDLDFSAILAASAAPNPSVVPIRTANFDPNLMAEPLLAALRAVQTELVAGALLTVDPHRHRVRLLPLTQAPT
jgi:predicted nuclease of predicted toxin-antitoxin system